MGWQAWVVIIGSGNCDGPCCMGAPPVSCRPGINLYPQRHALAGTKGFPPFIDAKIPGYRRVAQFLFRYYIVLVVFMCKLAEDLFFVKKAPVWNQVLVSMGG